MMESLHTVSIDACILMASYNGDMLHDGIPTYSKLISMHVDGMCNGMMLYDGIRVCSRLDACMWMACVMAICCIMNPYIQ